mgnify:FL=1
MEFINSILAKFFETFKTKNPTLAAGIILFLGTIVYLSDNGLGTVIGYDLTVIVKYVSIALGFLTGAHTTKILEKEKK